MQTTFVGQDAVTQSPRTRFRRNFAAPLQIPSRNVSAAAPGNGVAARDKTSLAAPNEQGNGTGNRALIAALVNSRDLPGIRTGVHQFDRAAGGIAAGGNLAVAPSQQAKRKSVLRVDGAEEPRVRRLLAGAGTALRKGGPRTAEPSCVRSGCATPPCRCG